MREVIYAAAVATVLCGINVQAQERAQVNELGIIRVEGASNSLNWQQLSQQESRVRAMGAEPDAVTLDTVASQHTSVVNRDELERINAMNTLDVLARIPGVSAARTGSLDGTILLRGMNSSGFRVPMFINGDRFRGRPSFQFMMIGPSELERVEVIRGPASIRYGSDGLSGLVNFVTRRPKGTLDDTFQFQGGQAELTYRSNGNAFQESLSVEAAGNNTDFIAYVTARQAQDYKTPAGKIANSHYKTAGAGFMAGYMPSAQERYELSYRYGEIRDGTSNGNTTDNQWSRRKPLSIHQVRLGYDGNYDHPLLAHIDASLYLNYFESKLETVTISNGGATEKRQVNNIRGPNIFGGHITFDTQRNAAGLALSTGLDFAHDHWLGNRSHIRVTNNKTGMTTDNGNPRTGREMHQFNVGAFALADWEITPDWTVNMGARYNYYKSDTEIAFLENEALRPAFEAAKNTKTHAWTGSIGTSYFLNDVVELTASYGSGFRMPWHIQMYSSGWDGENYTIPNPKLKPEYSTTAEIGMRLHLNDAFVDLAAFEARYRNFLETTQTTYLGLPATQTQNIGKARIRGLELSGKWQLNSQINLHGNLSYVHGVNRNTNRALTGLAPWSGTLGAQYVGANDAWAVTGEVQFAKGQTRWDPATEYRAAGYGLVNAYAQFQLDRMGFEQLKNTQIVLGVTNLFDKEYRSASTSSVMSRPMSSLNPLVSPGRSLNLTLRSHF